MRQIITPPLAVKMASHVQHAVSTPLDDASFSQLQLRLHTAVPVMEEHINHACDFLCDLSDDEISRYGADFDRLLLRIGPLRGWTPRNLSIGPLRGETPPTPPSMITATAMLDAIKKEMIHIRKLHSRDILACVLDHIEKSRDNRDPRLWFSSLRNKPTFMDRVLHVLYILHHTNACGGSAINHLERVLNPEESFKGLIPTYCKEHHLDRPTMVRCIARGCKMQSFGHWLGEPGIKIVAAPVVTLFSRISYREIQTVSGPLRLQYPEVLELARVCHRSQQQCQDILQIAIRAQLRRTRVMST